MTLKKQCITVYGETQDGEKFRPSTPSPGMHWAYMLIDPFDKSDEIHIRWVENGITLTISKGFTDEPNQAFEHVMSFIKLHNLKYEIDESECAKCPGHEACLRNQELQD